MLSQDEVEELTAKKLCYRCVGEDYLSAEIRRDGKRRKCSYCDRTAKSYLIGEMAERVEAAFDQHYARTSDQPTSWQQTMLSDRESEYEWDRDGEQTVDAVMNSADMPEAAAEDIQQILEDKFDDFDSAALGEETEFSSDAYYEQKGTSDQAWQEEWRSFEKSLKTEARFFSRAAASHLAAIFNGIDVLRSRDGRPLVVDAGPGTSFSSVYRARVFQSDDKLEAALCRPDQQLGSPPAFLASAGRMNARGISVFYGANDPTAAIAEVRPPVGSQVAVAQFEIIRPLKLLDLTALSAVSDGGSVFDPELAGRLERAMFLRSLSQRITRPVMPDDEHFEYLATQAVADFLATEGAISLDGIIFPSVQAAGAVLNVVFFHKAARVEKLAVPVGAEISARSGHMEEDGWETEYEVIEEVPAAPDEPPPVKEEAAGWPDFASLAAMQWGPPDPDWRDPSLRVVLDSVVVHRVRRVEFETDEFSVARRRWQKRKPDF
ncbi:RES family NAD+ phosphorylase [Bosea sp. CRIB-10]|uniref:RES family NAD+ phosphorylase n=1 Tax=Hyphomicrobiales TaxID=356 RepID=UPI00111359E7|nr:RES family NAD+ phosphorylase [Bosea sp. CRIB-10]